VKQIVALYLAQAREFLRDRSAVLFVLLLPVAFGVFFGLVFSEGGSFVLQLGVTNEDRGPVGAEIIATLNAPQLQKGIVVHTGSRAELLDTLESGEIHVLLVLPADLSEGLAERRQVYLRITY